jgi:hypothetical protein
MAQRIAGRKDISTTRLYDRKNDDVDFGDIERVGI